VRPDSAPSTRRPHFAFRSSAGAAASDYGAGPHLGGWLQPVPVLIIPKIRVPEFAAQQYLAQTKANTDDAEELSSTGIRPADFKRELERHRNILERMREDFGGARERNWDLLEAADAAASRPTTRNFTHCSPKLRTTRQPALRRRMTHGYLSQAFCGFSTTQPRGVLVWCSFASATMPHLSR